MSSNSSSGHDDSQARTDLKLVDEKARTRSVGPTPGPQGARGHGSTARPVRRVLPIWLFTVVVVILCLALVWQVRIAGRLESQVVSLENELTEVSVQLDAHRNRLMEIRDGVQDVSARLEGLRTLVESDPVQVAPGSTESPPTTADAIDELEPVGPDALMTP